MATGKKEWLTLEEAADLAGRSKETIRNWIKAGYLQAYRKPADMRVYVRAEEVNTFINLPPAPVEKPGEEA